MRLKRKNVRMTNPKHPPAHKTTSAEIEASVRAGNDVDLVAHEKAPAKTAAALIGALPSAFPPDALAQLAHARDALRAAEVAAERLVAEADKACASRDSAVATLEAARSRALEAATLLVGHDLADNFFTLSDDEAKKVAAAAQAARLGVPAFIRAKLLG